MKVLRLHFNLPVAHWRIPFTQQNIHRSYPLPPPSTVLGMIHNICGCKTDEVIPCLDMAIMGNYEYIFYQYQLLRNLNESIKPPYKEAHCGQPMPTKVQLLGNVKLYIYLRKYEKSLLFNINDYPTEKIKNLSLEEIKEYFENPRVPFCLGRKEDIAILEKIEFINIEKDYLPFSTGKFSLWLPFKKAVEIGINGPVYLLPAYYTKINNIRNFNKIRCVFIESQPFPLVEREVKKEFIDKELNIAVFFIGENKDAGNTCKKQW